MLLLRRGGGFGRGFRFRARVFPAPQTVPIQQVPAQTTPVYPQQLPIQQPVTPKDEKAFLEQEKNYVKEEIESL